MSVRKSERTEGKLLVLEAMKELTAYTLRICSNEKVFPKKYRWVTTQKIVNICLDAEVNIQRANAIRVTYDMDYKIRRNCQLEARADIYALLALVDVSFRAFNIEPRRIEYWTGLIDKVDEYLNAWINADFKRYKDLIAGQ